MIVDKEELQRAILNGYSDDVRRQLLNSRQLMLLKTIANTEYYTAAELTKVDNIYIQAANSRLRTLYDKGYLNRTNMGAATGGIEYYYTATDLVLEVFKEAN